MFLRKRVPEHNKRYLSSYSMFPSKSFGHRSYVASTISLASFCFSWMPRATCCLHMFAKHWLCASRSMCKNSQSCSQQLTDTAWYSNEQQDLWDWNFAARGDWQHDLWHRPKLLILVNMTADVSHGFSSFRARDISCLVQAILAMCVQRRAENGSVVSHFLCYHFQ